MNFNCIFPICIFKHNNVNKEVFLKHLDEFHDKEIMQISKKEKISLQMAKMIAVSNSTVFINSG